MTYWLLPLTFQLVLQSIVLFPVSLIFGKPVGFREGVLLVQWHEWFDRRWPFATTLAYIMGGSPWDLDSPRFWFHEVGVHVKQYEDLAVLGSILAGVVMAYGAVTGHHVWPLALGIWASAGPLWLAPNFVTAFRFRKAWKELRWKTWKGLYRFSEHERSAYAQTAAWERNGGR